MKKLIYSAAALAMAFFAASCQQEMFEPVAQESTVTYSVELPALQTKAIGDGFNVDQLVYEVWKTKNANVRNLKDPAEEATRLYQATAVMTKKDGEQKTIISLNLVHDQNYTVLFWAQNSKAINNATPAYDTDDLTAVTYASEVTDGSYLSNNENMAAFYQTEFILAADVEKPGMRRTELKRPFAQLNIGTKNTAKEYEITMTQSRVTISDVPTVFDVAQNTPATPTVSGSKSFVFEYNGLPKDPATLTVNNHDYHYVAMNYIFAGSQNVTVTYDIDASLKAYDTGATTSATISNEVIEVPLKENYRTNIVGNLLTSTTQYEVVIDASWEDVYEDNWDGNVVEVWDENYIQEPKMVNGVYEISLASELAWVSAKVNGMPYVDPETNSVKYKAPETFSGVKFVLVEDIDLVGEDGDELVWIPIGVNKALKYSDTFRGTFDGQGHVIKNMTVKNPEVAGLFGYMTEGTIKNVVIENFNITANHYAGAIVGWVEGSKVTVDGCTVRNGEITVTVSDKDLGDKAGGIVGFAHSGTYTNNTVSGVVINGYRDLGGVAGNLQGTGVVKDNKVTNVIVTADLTPEYAGTKAANAGMVVGRINSDGVTIENNTTTDVQAIVIVDSVAEMNVAAGHDKTYIYMQPGEYNFDQAVNVDGTLQVKAGSDVVLNGHDFGVTVGTAADYGFKVAGEGTSLVINDTEITSKGGTISAIEGANITVNGGSMFLSSASTSGRYLIYATGQGTEVVINGGNYSWDTAKNNKRAYVYTTAGATVRINGGTFAKASSRSGYTTGILGDGTVIITGGTFGFDPTAWVAAGYHVKKDGQNWVVVSLSEGDNLKEAVAVAGATVNMAAGEYTFPSSSIASGVTINCEEGTVFTGNSKLNIKGATVKGATFSNPTGTAVDQTINGTFENCTFTGSNALRWCYAGETVVFKNCIFSGDVYGVHFDGGANEVYFENCEFSGFNALAAAVELATFKGCTFKANSTSNYNGINLWGSVKMIDTQFVFDGSVDNEWVDCCSAGKTYEFTNCTINNGSILDMNYFSARNNGTKIIINGVEYSYALNTDGFNVDGNVLVANGEYSLPAIQNKTVKIVGSSEAVITINKPNMSGTDITFEGVTLKGSGYATGVQHVNNVTYKGVKVIGEMCLYGEQVVFNNSTFELNNQYVWTYGVKNAEFNGCTFNTNGKAILVYNEGAGATNVAVEGCIFNATAGAKAGAIANQNCAAIEIDNYQSSGVGVAHNVTASNNTYSDNFSGEWRIKNFVAGNPINVNGVEYTSIAVDGKLMTIDADKNVTVLE